jgi:hypothetical protein
MGGGTSAGRAGPGFAGSYAEASARPYHAKNAPIIAEKNIAVSVNSRLKNACRLGLR